MLKILFDIELIQDIEVSQFTFPGCGAKEV